MPRSSNPVAVALGSNLGDRAAQIAEAVRRLEGAGGAGVRVERVSSLYETAPAGWTDGARRIPWFLNAVCVGRTEERPQALLSRLREVEAALGRSRGGGLRPRAIDLDLIFYGRSVVRSPTLVLPHPRFRERAFVLLPLREVAPDWVDPVTGKSVAELVRLLRGWEGSVRRHTGGGG